MDKRIYIWGIGKGMEYIEDSIYLDKVQICGYIDNDIEKQGQEYNSHRIISFQQISDEYDYILVTSVYRYSEIKQQLSEQNVPDEKILLYFDKYDKNFNNEINFINLTVRNIHLADVECRKLFREYDRKIQQYKLLLSNIEYEIADKIRNNQYKFPIIRSDVETLELIIKERCSICRFGDAEFEMIFERERSAFQNVCVSLAERLRQIVNSSDEGIIICIADLYGCLDKHTEASANAVRSYLSKGVREEHMALLDLNKIYYDAYVSRPYINHKDKSHADIIFSMWKMVWENRDVVIVEGELTRNGLKNDLFKGTSKIRRILCPTENVWIKYDEILKYILDNITKDELILITLGPTATVLAYDLAREGYQALDIGQVDNEYEWYLRKAASQVDIPYKYVYEFGPAGWVVADVDDQEYNSQVIARIGLE